MPKNRRKFQLNCDPHDEEFVNQKILMEERKLLLAQRKLESIRLLDELLERVKVNISFEARDRVRMPEPRPDDHPGLGSLPSGIFVHCWTLEFGRLNIQIVFQVKMMTALHYILNFLV